MKPQVYKDPRPSEHFDRFHERQRTKRPNWMYELVRLVLTPYLLLIYRARCIDSHHVPHEGPVIIAPNHFSFLDHFFVAVYLRRKVQFMAKSQLFKAPMQVVYHNGGVFPVRRGHKDDEAFKTAHAILGRGDVVVMYAEAGRSRTGELGKPRHGIGKLALESGAAVVPDRDRGNRAGAQLEAPSVPEGDRAFRGAGPVRAGGRTDEGAGSGGVRDRLRERPPHAREARGRGPQERGQGRAREPAHRSGVTRALPLPPANGSIEDHQVSCLGHLYGALTRTVARKPAPSPL